MFALSCLLALSLACSGDKLPPPPDQETPTDDTAAATDSPADSDPPPIDSGDSTPQDTEPPEDTDPPTPARARLVNGERVDCPNPDLRENGPPYLQPSLGEDWEHQNATGEQQHKLGGGLTIADLTGDGLYDIFLPQTYQDQLYVGQEDGSLSDESASRLPELDSWSAGATAVDVDGDADLDLYLCNLDGPDYLLINDGSGHFSDGTEASGFGVATPRICTGSSWGDMDGDGDLDAFVLSYRQCEVEGDEERSTSPGNLWENQGDGTFVDVSDRLPREVLEASVMRTITWLDLDGDGDQDLYLANDALHGVDCLYGNRVFLNQGDGSFVDGSEGTGVERRMGGMGIGIGDLNGDERPDMLMSDTQNIVLFESYDTLSWVDAALLHGLDLDPEAESRSAGWGTLLSDMDNDGDLDGVMVFGAIPEGAELPVGSGLGDDDSGQVYYNVQAQPDAVYLQGEDGTFEDVGEAWGLHDNESHRGLATVDLNGDGYLDMVRRVLDGDAKIHYAQCGAGAWIEVMLQQPGMNVYAVGAVVQARAGESRWTRWNLLAGTSLLTSTQPLVHFGLGDVDTLDELTVTWPDGQVSSFTDVSTRQRLAVIREQ